MEENIHVTKCQNKVQREIGFIFPNHIQEPILLPDRTKFCANNLIVETTVNTLYDIVTNSDKETHQNWKNKLAKALIVTDKSLPRIYNQCCHSLRLNAQDIAQQTEITCLQLTEKNENAVRKSFSSDLSQDCSSLNFTTSSCVSCSGFDGGAVCLQQINQQALEEIIKSRTAPLEMPKQSSSSTHHIEKENILEGENEEEQIAADNLHDVLVQQEENQDIFEGDTISHLDILLEKDKSLEKDIITDKMVNNNEAISGNDDVIEKGSTHLSNEEITTNLANVIPDGEENNNAEEEIQRIAEEAAEE